MADRSSSFAEFAETLPEVPDSRACPDYQHRPDPRAPQEDDFDTLHDWFVAFEQWERDQAALAKAEHGRRIPTRGTLFPAETFQPISFRDILDHTKGT